MNRLLADRKLFFINVSELMVLLLLPLPFLDLNVLYVILVLMITFSSKYLRKDKWRDIGFRRTNMNTMIAAIFIGVIFGFADNYLVEPILSNLMGKAPDLTSFESLEGNLLMLFILLILGWVVGGLFEEYFFRGYLFHRLKSIFINPILHKWISIVLVSVVFGFSHYYQGITGVVATFYFSIVMGLLYFYFNRNIWYLVVVHGVFDTIGIFKLYLGH